MRIESALRRSTSSRGLQLLMWVGSVACGLLPTLAWGHDGIEPAAPAGVCEIATPNDPAEHPAPFDCTFVEDTGYVQGDPYPITVFHIDDKPVGLEPGNAFWVMREAAAQDGVDIHIVSGFRTNAEQQYLYDCYVNCNCNNCNLAAPPGYSNHQSGHAFDLNTTGYGGAVYNWLAANAASYGFANTVAGEHWHWEWWEGGPGGGICSLNHPPRGRFEAADCEGLTGWAKDPDQPDTPTQVHLYFDGEAGDPEAVGVPVLADEHRPDLCEEPGAGCDYGYSLPIPMSLRDGQPHTVSAYVIDLEGEENTPLPDETFTCPPPELAGGRRPIDPQALQNWQFSEFSHLAPVSPEEVEALPEWLALELTPRLVTTDEPEAAVWLIDAGMRRHVPDAEVAAAWSLDLDSAEVVTPEALSQWPEWLDLRPTPVLVKASDGALYLVDDIIEQGDPPDSDSDSHGDDPTGTTGSDGSDGDTDGSSSDTDDTFGLQNGEAAGDGCSCRSTPTPGAWGLWLLGLAGWLRRRRPDSVTASPADVSTPR